jgi:hypothetical protein
MKLNLEDIGSEWARDLVIVLQKHDAPLLDNLYDYMKKYRRDTGRTWSPKMKSTIRCTLQRHCRKCDQYQGKHDLFENLVNGCWRLKPELEIKIVV